MGYSVVDIINKGITNAETRKFMHEKIGQEKANIPAIKIFSKVFMKVEDKNIHYYENLRKEIENLEFEEIDFVIYDKIAFLINEVNSNINAPEINNVKQYLEFALALNKDTYSLLVNIQGRLIKSANDINSKTYRVLAEVINNITKQVANIEKTLKKNKL
jgi:hypothetical protein